MTGLDKIIEHIKQDAQATADAKIAEAKAEAQELLAKAAEEEKELLAEARRLLMQPVLRQRREAYLRQHWLSVRFS